MVGSTKALIALVGAHVILAVLFDRIRMAGVLHAIIVVAFGLVAALARQPLATGMAMAYAGSSEVLWRLLKLPTPWELSKYTILLLASVHIMRTGTQHRAWRLPAMVVLLLLPSCLVVAADPQFNGAKVWEVLSFGLVAPAALGAALAVAGTLHFSRREFTALALSAVLPAVTLAAVTALRTYTRSDLVFTGESNFATSGGFGPSQVSTMLSFGATLSLAVALETTGNLFQRVIMLAVAAGVLLQSIMTFSRGGLYNMVGAIAIALPWLYARRSLRKWLVGMLVAGALGVGFLFLKADAFTGGSLSRRFQQTQTTGRYELVMGDLELFLEHPILGVGPGASRYARTDMEGVSAHTEVTRLLSEHGVLGLAVILLFALAFVRRFASSRSHRDRSLFVMLSAWAALAQANAALRTSAPLIAVLLAFAMHDPDGEHTGDLR
ncbi:MAG: O-antigen ligase family protein [Gemmatimonas sp.]